MEIVSEDIPAGAGQTALPGLSDAADNALRRELEELRRDNDRLRKLLELTEIESRAPHQDQPVIPAVMHRGPVSMDSSPVEKVCFFQDLFRARSDVYALRWENPRDGRSGWVPAVAGGWRKGANMAGASYLALIPGVVADHLRGLQHIGLYPLTEQDTCWWAYLSSLDRLSDREVTTHIRRLPAVKLGHEVRRLELPRSSKIVPRPALIVRTVFASRLTIKAADLGPAMISAVKHAASMPNPEFYERQRQRRSTWNIPRFLRNYDETLDGDLILPRGLLSLLHQLVESSGSTLRIDDQRAVGTAHSFEFTARLHGEQLGAMDAATATEQGILVAPPGTGKTVIACAAIARRGVSTLILVDRKALADQWRPAAYTSSWTKSAAK